MSKCLICQALCEPFISFGKMPIANGFLTKEKFENEYFFEMKVAFCKNCGMVQLVEQPEKEKMFNENYAFFSGTSKNMAIHFKEFADHVVKDYIASKNPFVVEIGSNDGIMLQNFAAQKIRHLGIEPSANVAKVAIDKGINTISEFFDGELARKIVKKHGQADAFLAANVMCHIPYLHSVVEGIKILLKSDGIAMFEDPYLGDFIENTTYDQIYDEHVFLFSLFSIRYLFEQHEMELIDVEPQETHGGSMRYVIAHRGARPVSKNVFSQLEKEKKLGLDKEITYDNFRKNCEESRDALMSLLKDIKKQGKRIVGYAATSKSTTVINYCGITTEHLEFISDTTPIKQGKTSPGAHIPVRPYQEFLNNYPEYALLFAYNHSKEIMAKEKGFMSSGGKWIVYVPKVQVLK
ncbi:MAG: class I SAM-dependent methyltransferase [Candidatus Saganbacteria bacterium]|nr:class I SAM-dependent methyltransferase [Candidatus Saganbacteria bacterium]